MPGCNSQTQYTSGWCNSILWFQGREQRDDQTASLTPHGVSGLKYAEGEQTRAMMQANEIQQLRDKVNSLEADNRMYGVVRYPNGYTYTAGPSPFCGCNSGCGCA